MGLLKHVILFAGKMQLTKIQYFRFSVDSIMLCLIWLLQDQLISNLGLDTSKNSIKYYYIMVPGLTNRLHSGVLVVQMQPKCC